MAQGGDELRQPGPRRLAAGRADQAAGAVERARHQLARQEPVLLVAAREPQVTGLLTRKAEPGVVGRVADQEYGAVAEPPSVIERPAYQGAADAAAAVVRVHGQRAEQQRRPGNAGRDVPEPDRADDAAAVAGDEREPGGRAAAFAQAL